MFVSRVACYSVRVFVELNQGTRTCLVRPSIPAMYRGQTKRSRERLYGLLKTIVPIFVLFLPTLANVSQSLVSDFL